MARVEQSLPVAASLAETWDFYFDPRGWPSWVDGFARVESASGYPDAGGTLVWSSNPAGRGRVAEKVLEHEPRRRHRIEFTDPQSSGELVSAFAIEGEATRVTLTLEYRLARGGLFARLADRVFVRGQVAGALERTLLRFKHEAEEATRLAAPASGGSGEDRSPPPPPSPAAAR